MDPVRVTHTKTFLDGEALVIRTKMLRHDNGSPRRPGAGSKGSRSFRQLFLVRVTWPFEAPAFTLVENYGQGTFEAPAGKPLVGQLQIQWRANTEDVALDLLDQFVVTHLQGGYHFYSEVNDRPPAPEVLDLLDLRPADPAPFHTPLAQEVEAVTAVVDKLVRRALAELDAGHKMAAVHTRLELLEMAEKLHQLSLETEGKIKALNALLAEELEIGSPS